MKTEETVREDGLRIVTVRVPSKKVFVELRVGVGSAHDPHEKPGLHHFFEHMAFKGTKKRPLDTLTSFRQRNCLRWGASTGRLFTSYNGEAVHKKRFLLFDFIADIGFNSIFPPEELEREKEVVRNEIARDQDNDMLVAFRVFWSNLWRENPLREFGVGSPEGVHRVSRDDLIFTQNLCYAPSNSVIISVGNIDHSEFVHEANIHIPFNSGRASTKRYWDDAA